MEADINLIYANIGNKAYKYLGSGSGRRVFDLNDDTVIKIAKNKRGLAQNQIEYEISTAESSQLFAKVLYASKDFKYIIMERADRINSIYYVYKYFNVSSSSRLKEVKEIKEILNKYNLLMSDLSRSVNWGKKNDRPVIIDYGFTREVRKRFY